MVDLITLEDFVTSTIRISNIDFLLIDSKKLRKGECSLRDAQGRKLCPVCNKWLQINKFNTHNATRDKLQHMCISCFRFASKQRVYKLSRDALLNMLNTQNNQCAICSTNIAKLFFIDHDHSCCPDRKNTCGKCVRGLLCGACNLALGAFKDNVDSLKKAIRYITKQGEKK